MNSAITFKLWETLNGVNLRQKRIVLLGSYTESTSSARTLSWFRGFGC